MLQRRRAGFVARAASSRSILAAVTGERIVAAALKALPDAAAASPSADRYTDAELIVARLRQVAVHPEVLHINLVSDDDREPIQIAWIAKRNHQRREIITPPGSERVGLRPMKVEDRARILTAIARSRAWVDDLLACRVVSTDAIAAREACSERSVRMVLPLAHLSPRIVRAIIAGRLPRGIGIRHLAELPASWLEQEHALGF